MSIGIAVQTAGRVNTADRAMQFDPNPERGREVERRAEDAILAHLPMRPATRPRRVLTPAAFNDHVSLVPEQGG
jgi:hypothetical protein